MLSSLVCSWLSATVLASKYTTWPNVLPDGKLQMPFKKKYTQGAVVATKDCLSDMLRGWGFILSTAHTGYRDLHTCNPSSQGRRQGDQKS